MPMAVFESHMVPHSGHVVWNNRLHSRVPRHDFGSNERLYGIPNKPVPYPRKSIPRRQPQGIWVVNRDWVRGGQDQKRASQKFKRPLIRLAANKQIRTRASSELRARTTYCHPQAFEPYFVQTLDKAGNETEYLVVKPQDVATKVKVATKCSYKYPGQGCVGKVQFGVGKIAPSAVYIPTNRDKPAVNSLARKFSVTKVASTRGSRRGRVMSRSKSIEAVDRRSQFRNTGNSNNNALMYEPNGTKKCKNQDVLNCDRLIGARDSRKIKERKVSVKRNNYNDQHKKFSDKSVLGTISGESSVSIKSAVSTHEGDTTNEGDTTHDTPTYESIDHLDWSDEQGNSKQFNSFNNCDQADKSNNVTQTRGAFSEIPDSIENLDRKEIPDAHLLSNVVNAIKNKNDHFSSIFLDGIMKSIEHKNLGILAQSTTAVRKPANSDSIMAYNLQKESNNMSSNFILRPKCGSIKRNILYRSNSIDSIRNETLNNRNKFAKSPSQMTDSGVSSSRHQLSNQSSPISLRSNDSDFPSNKNNQSNTVTANVHCVSPPHSRENAAAEGNNGEGQIRSDNSAKVHDDKKSGRSLNNGGESNVNSRNLLSQINKAVMQGTWEELDEEIIIPRPFRLADVGNLKWDLPPNRQQVAAGVCSPPNRSDQKRGDYRSNKILDDDTRVGKQVYAANRGRRKTACLSDCGGSVNGAEKYRSYESLPADYDTSNSRLAVRQRYGPGALLTDYRFNKPSHASSVSCYDSISADYSTYSEREATESGRSVASGTIRRRIYLTGTEMCDLKRHTDNLRRSRRARRRNAPQRKAKVKAKLSPCMSGDPFRGESIMSSLRHTARRYDGSLSRLQSCDECFMRKKDLRELKMLQKLENKQYQDLDYKAQVASTGQTDRFTNETTNLMRQFDTDLDILTRQQKQQVEKAEMSQTSEMKLARKKIITEQEKEVKSFREYQRQEIKLLKQELNLLPKDTYKDALRKRREEKDVEQKEKENSFLIGQQERLRNNMDQIMDQHREKIAMLESQFLEQKQHLLRAREAAIWDMEKNQLHEKHQLAKSQLKDFFFLKRHQMLHRHHKELEQMKRINSTKEEEMLRRHTEEKKRLPKIQKAESKTRAQMFKQSLRMSMVGSPDDDRFKIKQFDENEKKRMKSEQLRQEMKHKKQWDDLIMRNEGNMKELEQLQAEKRKMLMEHETQKIKELDEQYQNELKEWKSRLQPRKQKLEDEFAFQRSEQSKFYGSALEGEHQGVSAGLSAMNSVRTRQSTII